MLSPILIRFSGSEHVRNPILMHQSKNILFIVHDATIYGSQQSLKLILDQMTENLGSGFQVWVSLARSGPFENKLLENKRLTLLKHKRLQWFKHDRRNKLQHIIDPLTVMLNAPSRVLKLYRYIRQYEIDLVHTNSVVSLEGAMAAKLAGIPHVWHVRELFMEDSAKLVPVFGKIFTRRLIQALSSRVICISKIVQRQFDNDLPTYQEKYPVIYNALNPGQIPPQAFIESRRENNPDQQGKLILGYAGRISEGKRLHDVLEALSELKRQEISDEELPTLLVAGDYVDEAYRKKIEALLLKYHLGATVQMLGYQNDLAAFYGKIDCLLIPSKNEPFGRVAIEAMAYGVPCIGAESGGLPEIIDDGRNGWLYPVGNIDSLAARIRHIMEHENELQRAGDQSRQDAEQRFHVSHQWSRLQSVYQELLPKPSMP